MDVDGFDIGDAGDLDLQPLWLRRLAWDAIPCNLAPAIHRELGLLPAGDEQQEDNDHVASHKRIALIEPLVDSVQFLAPMMAQVVTKSILANMKKHGNEIPDVPGIEEKIIEQNIEIIRASTLTIIAQFLSLGVLEYVEKGRPDVILGQ